jgi:hypothetical protein
LLYKDQSGLELHAHDAAMVTRLDQAVDRLVHFEYRIIEPVFPAIEDSQFFPMAYVLSAYLGGLSTDAQIVARQSSAFSRFKAHISGHDLTPRESGHMKAAEALICGDLSRSARILADISLRYPEDVLALSIGHQVDYLLGDTRSLRDRIGAALPFWEEGSRYYPAILGMYAFGLGENGHWSYAEDVGVRAAETDPRNVWAIHAVAHSFEMRACSDRGVNWLDSNRACWTRENQMQSHVWWHYCLYLLESGDAASVLSIYDQSMAPAKIDHVPAKLVNGSSMLWRLYLQGIEVAGRFADIAEAWQSHVDHPWCAFNDIHAVMCYVGMGNHDAAARLVSDRRKYILSASPHVHNVTVTAEIGLPVCKAIMAFGRGRYDDAFDFLYPIRHAIHRCGGSNAQRDVIQQTLVEAAIGAGRWPEAQGLVGERLAIRPGRRFNQMKNRELAGLGAMRSAL